VAHAGRSSVGTPLHSLQVRTLAPIVSAAQVSDRPFDTPSQIDGKVMELKWVASEGVRRL
jgi:hypothetical protein